MSSVPIKQFDIVYVDLGDVVGSEQGKIRPCVVIQNDIGNKFSPTTIIMPMTHIIKQSNMPTHTIVDIKDAIGLSMKSMILGEQVKIIDKKRIKNKIGRVTSDPAKREIARVYNANFFTGELYA